MARGSHWEPFKNSGQGVFEISRVGLGLGRVTRLSNITGRVEAGVTLTRPDPRVVTRPVKSSDNNNKIVIIITIGTILILSTY